MGKTVHNIPPLYDGESKILILGSFPSVKSREGKFFYNHPQNRFWKTLAEIFGESVPTSIDDKKSFLHSHHIALWDVIGECEVNGSSDSSITNIVPNDISLILKKTQIKTIFCNGAVSYKNYCKYIFPSTHMYAFKLPSTSPANAAYSLERLKKEWKIIDAEL